MIAVSPALLSKACSKCMLELTFGYFKGHLPVAILQQKQNKFMSATILITNFIVNNLEHIFPSTSGKLLLMHNSYTVVNISKFYEAALTEQI